MIGRGEGGERRAVLELQVVGRRGRRSAASVGAQRHLGNGHGGVVRKDTCVTGQAGPHQPVLADGGAEIMGKPAIGTQTLAGGEEEAADNAAARRDWTGLFGVGRSRFPDYGCVFGGSAEVVEEAVIVIVIVVVVVVVVIVVIVVVVVDVILVLVLILIVVVMVVV